MGSVLGLNSSDVQLEQKAVWELRANTDVVFGALNASELLTYSTAEQSHSSATTGTGSETGSDSSLNMIALYCVLVLIAVVILPIAVVVSIAVHHLELVISGRLMADAVTCCTCDRLSARTSKSSACSRWCRWR